MKQWFALSAIGSNRPGIVADLSELIYECDCNLEDSSMTVLGSEFAVLLLLSGVGDDVAERLSTACKRIEWEKRLTVFFRPLDEAPATVAASDHPVELALQVTGADKAGIVARVSRCLADHGINIRHMESQSRPEPGSGSPVYTMKIQMEAPADLDEPSLRQRLDAIGGEIYVDINLERVRDGANSLRS